MSIRRAEPGDAAPLLALARGCFGAAAWDPFQYWNRDDHEVLVADLGGGNCGGFCVLACAADEAEIQSLAVAPAMRRQGIGALLLQATLTAARERGAAHVHLEVRESNTAARAFYRRHGFQETGRRRLYYRDPEEAAVLMQIVLAYWASPDARPAGFPRGPSRSSVKRVARRSRAGTRASHLIERIKSLS